MKIFCSASRGGEEAAKVYEEAIRAAGHEVCTGSAQALLAADALFVYLAGGSHAEVKADVNLALDRRMPVACVRAEGAQLDRGLEMQLGLATRISQEAAREDLAIWLENLKRVKKAPQGPNKGQIAVICVAAAIVLAGIAFYAHRSSEARRAAEATAQAEAAEEAARQEEQALRDTYFGGADPADLKELDLSGRGLSDLSFLEKAPGLEKLDLSDNAIEDISALGTLTALKELDLSGNKITDVNVLLALTDLERVDLSGNPIADTTALDYLGDVEIILE